MAELRFALIGEGSTDEALLPLIQWLLRDLLPSVDILGSWANRSQVPVPQPRALAERIAATLLGVPHDILFIHRDADRAGRRARVDEIERAANQGRTHVMSRQPVIPVVPVRETEAWLLCDEMAIRSGARNPNGRVHLALPRPNRVESIADPKRLLTDLLRTASELRGRHLDRLVIDPVAVAVRITDFSPLRQLPAFQAFEEDVRQVIQDQGWPERLG